MSVRAGLRNPYTEPGSAKPRRKTRISKMLEPNSKFESSDDESLFDGEGNYIFPMFNPSRVKKKKKMSELAGRKEIKLAMKSFKNLLQRTASPSYIRRVRFGIMVG